MMKTKKIAAALAAGALALGLSVASAVASTVSFTNVSSATTAQRLTAYEAFQPGLDRIAVDWGTATNTAGTIATNVGSFVSLGGTGSGASITGDPTQVQIRTGNNFGRFNVLSSGGSFIDSNDTFGIQWTVGNTFGGRLGGMSAFLTDPNDAGGRLTVTLLNGQQTLFSQTLGTALGNSTVWHMTANFTGLNWTQAVFNFQMNRLNDGIGLSNMTLHVAPIPLPAGGLLLLGALGALGMAARRRRAAA